VDDETHTPGDGRQPHDATPDGEFEGAPEAAPAAFAGPPEEAQVDDWDPASTHFRVVGESSPNPAICPFLRSSVDDVLGLPIETPDPKNRCVAVGRPAPQSGRQQELVCLTRGHSNCPRYLRGAMILGEPPGQSLAGKGPSVAIVAAAITLAIAASMSVGFLLVRGGFDLPVASVAPSQLAVAVASTEPTATAAAPSESPSAVPTSTPSPPPESPSPSPSLLPTPSPSVAPTPSLTPAPTPTPTITPTSDRFAVIKACPSTPNCWIYTVRRGDNLRSIVNWFGVSYDTVLRMNPQITDATLIRAGDRIRIPRPTR
jgi:LysM domain-containing protein